MTKNNQIASVLSMDDGFSDASHSETHRPPENGPRHFKSEGAPYAESVCSTSVPGRKYGIFPLVVQADHCISVDIFDTLLYRKPVSEHRRFFMAATAWVRMSSYQPAPSIESVYAARCEANCWAYHSIDALSYDSEVKIADIFLRQLLILGLPASLLPLLIAAEIEVEKKVLAPNRNLIEWLKFQRHMKIPIIAISDTSMPGVCLQEIIDDVAGPSIIDRLYTSADLGVSKRNGGIFAAVASLEGIPVSRQLHFGDDKRADVVKACTAGVFATHLPRSRAFVIRRKMDGAFFLAHLWLKRFKNPVEGKTLTARLDGDARSFGRRVLGPVFALYCTRLWIYLSFADQSKGEPVALFCARGGLQLRAIFEVFLEKAGLPLDTPRADLMISRLVAVRAALLRKSPSAFDEIAREFCGSSMATIASAIAQKDIEFGPEWDGPFDTQTFLDLMTSTPAGEQFCKRLEEQNDLFTEHLESLTSKKKRLVLCDTGLFGSTLRMLQDGFPDRQWECLLFARSNYKGFPADHFAKTRGIISEKNRYDPFCGPSTVLRYWQLFEHIFEPDLQSVKTFTRTQTGAIVSNLETKDWQEHMDSTRSLLLQGIVDYLTELPCDGWFERLYREERKSWRSLKASVIFPDSDDVLVLNTGERSHDFGREEKYKTLPKTKKNSLMEKVRNLRTTRWKEGYIAQEFPVLRPFIQTALESVYIFRWLSSSKS